MIAQGFDGPRNRIRLRLGRIKLAGEDLRAEIDANFSNARYALESGCNLIRASWAVHARYPELCLARRGVAQRPDAVPKLADRRLDVRRVGACLHAVRPECQDLIGKVYAHIRDAFEARKGSFHLSGTARAIHTGDFKVKSTAGCPGWFGCDFAHDLAHNGMTWQKYRISSD